MEGNFNESVFKMQCIEVWWQYNVYLVGRSEQEMEFDSQ